METKTKIALFAVQNTLAAIIEEGIQRKTAGEILLEMEEYIKEVKTQGIKVK